MKQWVRRLVVSLGLLATAAQAGTTDGLSCGAIDGASSVTATGTVLMIGEMHGTEEIPSFVSDLVCSALDRDLSVTVALEIPKEEAERVTAYLGSDGGEAARAALLAGPFWTGEIQYGVSSEGMVALLESLRSARKDGLPVKVTLLDRRERTSPNARDTFMASRLVDAAKASPRDFVVSLTGNYHNRTRQGAPWDAEYRPMGLVVEEQLSDRRVVALDVAYTGGTAWNCRSNEAESCRPYELGGTRADGSGRRIVLDESLGENGYDGYYAVGSLTASPPAFRSSPEEEEAQKPSTAKTSASIDSV